MSSQGAGVPTGGGEEGQVAGGVEGLIEEPGGRALAVDVDDLGGDARGTRREEQGAKAPGVQRVVSTP